MSNNFYYIPNENILGIIKYLDEISLNCLLLTNYRFNLIINRNSKMICKQLLTNKYQLNLYHIPTKYISVWKSGIAKIEPEYGHYLNSSRPRRLNRGIKKGFNLSFFTDIETTGDWAKITRHINRYNTIIPT